MPYDIYNKRITDLENDYTRLDVVVRGDGNGTPGLVMRMAATEKSVARLESGIDRLVWLLVATIFTMVAGIVDHHFSR